MRIPVSLPPRRTAVICATWLALFLAGTAFSCRSKDTSQNRNVGDLQGTPATLDARGSIVDSNVYLQSRIAEGVAGNGGTIGISSTAGTVTVTSGPRTFNPLAIIAGLNVAGGLSVSSGTMEVHGGLLTSALFVGPGAELALVDSTNIQVSGDVLIQGLVRSRAESSAIRRDGHDLTISATGAVVVTGTINCSGADATDTPAANTTGTSDPRNPAKVGGNGGDISITAAGDITITGTVLAEGGSSDSLQTTTAVAGQGGAITISTTGGGLQFGGKMSVRAGNSFTNAGTAPSGGTIGLIAQGDVTLDETTRIDASGGKNSGALGGNGGSVTIGGTAGAASLSGVDLDVSGGKIFFTDGAAGNAGTASITGTTIDLSEMTLNARGGEVIDERQQFTDGTGGTGGTVTLSATAGNMTVADDVTFNARGGNSLGVTNAGGTGGIFSAVATGGVVTFNGSMDIRGGNSFGGQEGTSGTLCVTNPDGQQSLANITGSNPLSAVTVPCP